MTDGADNKSKQQMVIGLLILVVLSGLFFWAYEITWEEREAWTESSEEARRNPFFAAGQLLQMPGDAPPQKDHPSEYKRSYHLLDNLPSHEDLIIINGGRYTLSERRTDNLLQWLEQGGHAVVVAEQEYDPDMGSSDDHLLDQLGIRLHYEDFDELRRREYEDDDQPDESPDEDTTEPRVFADYPDEEEHCKNVNLIAWMTLDEAPFEGVTLTLDVFTSGYYHITLSDDEVVPTSLYERDQFRQREVGKGMLTVMTSIDLWKNDLLGCRDNAFLLKYLARDRDQVWFVDVRNQAQFLMVLWREHQLAVISVLLLLAVWLWRQTLRFGLVRTTKNEIRRNFMEHLQACARYQWRHGDGETLITTLRQQIIHRANLNLPNADPKAQCNAIARQCGLDEEATEQALYGPVPNKSDDLLKLVQQLQHIRKKL